MLARALRSSVAAAVPAVALVAICAWEVLATRCDATSVPDDDAWNAASAVVRREYKAGDLIVFAPDWVDPVGRLHFGDLISVNDAGRMDAARYARIWEVSIRGERAPETAGLKAALEEIRGGVTVRRVEQAPAVVTDDLLARPTTPGLTPVLAEVGFAPHRCVMLVPVAGRPAKLVVPAFALGNSLVGYMGIADVFTRRDNRAPAHLSVSIGGAEVARADAGVDDGWVRFSAKTTPGAADVTIVATSPADGRKICFALEARQ